MKRYLPVSALSIALCTFAVSPVFAAADYDYFKSQSCEELGKESDALQKAEKEVNDKMKKAESKANTQAVVTTLLVGWPFWGNVDHGDSHAMLKEIRDDLKYIKRAQKAKKCS